MIENIRQIDGFSRYFVSNKGYVIRVYENKILKLSPYQIRKGYLRVSLLDDSNRRYDKLVHRLVAESFIPNPHSKPQINHIDGRKKNNKVDNLEWATNRENQLHAYRIELRNPSHARRVRCIETGIEYDSITEAAEATGLWKNSISAVVNGRLKTTGGFRWEFCGHKEQLVKKEFEK